MSFDISRFKPWLQPKYFAAAAIVVALIIGAIFIYQGVAHRRSIPVVTPIHNGETNVSVTRDIVIEYPDAPRTNELQITQHFSISPSVIGAISVAGKNVTLTHEKNLEYNTKYAVTISKGVRIGDDTYTEDDFVVTFTTQGPPDGQRISAFSYSAFNAYTIDAYAAKAHITLNYGGEPHPYHVQLYRSSDAQYVKAAVDLDTVYGDAINGVDFTKYYDGAAALDDREITMTPETVYDPAITAEGVYMLKISDTSKNEDSHPTHIFVIYTKIAEKTYRLGDKMFSRVVDQRTGIGVKGATVISYNAKGDILFKDTTDKNGLATRALLQDDKTEKPTLIEVNAGASLVFTKPYFGMDQYYKAPENLGYIYTDRPLYTPGDTVHFKGIVRPQNHADRPRAGAQFTVQVGQSNYGSNPIVIYEKKLAINANGSFTDSVKLTKELKSGYYDVTIKDGDVVLGSNTFSVEYYQKPDFDVRAKTEKASYIRGQNIKVTVKPQYFFGGAVTHGKVDAVLASYYDEVGAHVTADLGKNGATIEIPTKDVSLGGGWWWDGGVGGGTPFFIDVTIIDDSGRRTTATEPVTLQQGEYSIKQTAPEFTWYLSSKESHVFTYKAVRIDGTPEVGRELKLTIQKDPWAYSEADKNKNTKTFTYKTDAKGEISHTVMFDGGGYYYFKVEGTDSMKNQIDTSTYVWVTGNGSANDTDGVAEKIFISFDKKEYKIGDTAHVSLELPEGSGDLFWSVNKKEFKKVGIEQIVDKHVTIDVAITEDLVPGFYFYADVFHNEGFVSESQMATVVGKKLNVTLTVPHDTTKPGENVSVGVYTTDDIGLPVAAETSVSVIDKALLALKSDQSGSIFDALYPAEGNDIRSFDSTMPIGSGYGAEKGGCFTGDTSILMAGGELKPIKDVRVGDHILTRSSESSSELRDDRVVKTFVHHVTDYLVINGLLNVTAEHRIFVNGHWMQIGEAKVGDWLIDAYGKQIEIRSIEKRHGDFTVYNLQTEKYHTFIANGFYVHNDKGGGPSVSNRSNFVDTAYWNAYVNTDEAGNGLVTFTLPDNTTTWAVRSKGVSEDGLVGDAKAEFLTTKPVIVRPVLPEFVRAGDTITIVGAVHNSTGSDQTFKTLLTAAGATVQDSTVKNVKIKNQDDAVLSWKMVIGRGPSLKLSMSAVAGDKQQDGVEYTIPVYESLTQIGGATSGNEPGNYSVTLTPGGDPSRATAKITIAPSVAAVIPDVISKLAGFPYGCVEQTMSHHLPNILAFRYANLGIEADKTKLTDSLNEGFDRLAKYQHPDGGFGWWEDDENNVWMSGYVYEGLYEAKQAGLLGGREGMYIRLGDYLKLNLPKMKPDEQAYIVYVLAKAEPNSTRDLTESLGKDLSKQDVQGLGYLALAAYNNGNKELAKQIVTTIKSQMTDSHWEFSGEYDYHGALKDRYSATGVNLLAISMIDHNESVEKGIVQWLMQHRTGYDGLWGSTRQSSQILYALVNYLQKSNELSPSYTYSVSLNGAKLKSGKLNSVKDSVVIDVPAKSLQQQNSLSITKNGNGNIFWSVQTSEFLNADALGQLKNSMPITREYLDQTGGAKTSFTPGDMVRVRLTFTAPRSTNHYLMVEDYLPATLRPINSSLENEGNDSSMYSRWWWYDEMDIRDQKVAVFRTWVNAGENRVEYNARVMLRGSFAAPAPVATFMYEPDSQGFGVPSSVVVK